MKLKIGDEIDLQKYFKLLRENVKENVERKATIIEVKKYYAICLSSSGYIECINGYNGNYVQTNNNGDVQNIRKPNERLIVSNANTNFSIIYLCGHKGITKCLESQTKSYISNEQTKAKKTLCPWCQGHNVTIQKEISS